MHKHFFFFLFLKKVKHSNLLVFLKDISSICKIHDFIMSIKQLCRYLCQIKLLCIKICDVAIAHIKPVFLETVEIIYLFCEHYKHNEGDLFGISIKDYWPALVDICINWFCNGCDCAIIPILVTRTRFPFLTR